MTFILLPLLLGIVGAGRAYNVYATITRAAREGARVAVANTCATCGNGPPAVSSVENAVVNTLKASSVDPSKIVIPSCTGNLSSVVCYQRDVQLNAGDTPVETGVVVGFTYPVTLNIPFTPVNATTFNITTTVSMREEN